MRLAPDAALRRIELDEVPSPRSRLPNPGIDPVIDQPPDASQEPEAAFELKSSTRPPFGWRDEHHVQAQRISAELLDHRVGIDDIPFDFDITAPSFNTIPCVSSWVNGSL